MIILVFAIKLQWFPAQGMVSARLQLEGTDYIIDVLRHLILPILTMIIYNLALMTRLTRSSMLETLGQDFIITARSKGLDENIVIYRHALRNALLPVVTILGINIGYVLAGAVLTETVFSWPGLGRLTYESALRRDYPIIMGMLVLTSIIVIVATLITDIVYSVLDPRIRYE
jgi:peptide/nickel transport system permease protein